MTDIRKEVHEEIDRMTDKQVAGLQEFLATYCARQSLVKEEDM